MTNIDFFIKACWTKGFLSNNESVLWNTFYNKTSEQVGGNLIFESEIYYKDIKNICKYFSKTHCYRVA
jgi:hypothetical protein